MTEDAPERRKAMLKRGVKILFFSTLAGLFVFGLLNFRNPARDKMVDTTITYTTTTYSQTIPLDVTPSVEEVVDSIPKYVSIPEGGLDWKLFAKTKSIPYSYDDENGKAAYGVKPEFPENLQKLGGQNIIMQGYMFPLHAEENQSVFLFGPFPVSCPYHYHVGPALVMEAHGREAIEFGFEPITLKGRLELVPRDDEYNVFYRLLEAERIE